MRPSPIVVLMTSLVLASPALAAIITDPPNHPPVAVASIKEDMDDLWTDMTVHFSSAGSYDIDGEGRLSYAWDFGDGSNHSILANPTHVYSDPGPYKVTLTVIDQVTVTDMATLNITVQRDYGETGVIIKAIGPKSTRTFFDPSPDRIDQLAVRRDGWVAYLCDLEKGDHIRVTITIIGDRPVDVLLFKHTDFIMYLNKPWYENLTYQFHELGVTDEVSIDFRAKKTDRYYVVIDNRDLPPTPTEGPVVYTIYIDPWLDKGDGYEPWAVSLWIGIAMAPVPIAMVAAVVLLRKRWRC